VTASGNPPDDPFRSPGVQQPSPSSAAGTLSPDGRWMWDGQQWQPTGAPGEPAAAAPQAYMPPPGGPYPGYGGVATPTVAAGPAPGLAYAGFWIRVVAYLIDSVILFVLVFILGIATGGLLRTDPTTGLQTVNGSLQGLSFILGALYFIGFWSARSQTPGMMALNLRIVRVQDGGPLDAGRAAIRYVGYLISGFVLCLGFLWVAFDPRKQGWHDKIAQTFVVRQV
jgi:uncharacterized RDD family membrane protein YckC